VACDVRNRDYGEPELDTVTLGPFGIRILKFLKEG
jgi:hypothetical protein